MRVIYYILVIVVAAMLGHILAFTDLIQKPELVVGSLVFFIFVYKPMVDAIFIRKMNLYKGKGLWKKYLCWSFRKKLLFKDS